MPRRIGWVRTSPGPRPADYNPRSRAGQRASKALAAPESIIVEIPGMIDFRDLLLMAGAGVIGGFVVALVGGVLLKRRSRTVAEELVARKFVLQDEQGEQ